jgi:hypothetical protein
MTVRTFIIAFLLSAFFSRGASAQAESTQTSAEGRTSRVILLRAAESFVKAINTGNALTALKLIDLPFLYRNQDWKDADVGEGHVLGVAHDRVFTDAKSAATFMDKLVKDVRVESAKAEKDGPSKSAMLTDYLAGAPASWRDLELFFFVRGTGDVEHVVLIGMDSASGRVRGVYTN